MLDRRRTVGGLNDAARVRRLLGQAQGAGRLHVTLACLTLLCAGCTPTLDLGSPPERSNTPEQVARGTLDEGPAVISRIRVEDARTEQFPEIVAVVTDRYGNPQVSLATRRPLAEEIADRIEPMLRQRGLFAPTGPDTLLVRIIRLRGIERLQAEVTVALTYRLFDAAGDELFVGTSDVMETGASLSGDETFFGYLGRFAYPSILGSPGLFPTTRTLREVTNAAVEKAIGQVLDNPDFKNALLRKHALYWERPDRPMQALHNSPTSIFRKPTS